MSSTRHLTYHSDLEGQLNYPFVGGKSSASSRLAPAAGGGDTGTRTVTWAWPSLGEAPQFSDAGSSFVKWGKAVVRIK